MHLIFLMIMAIAPGIGLAVYIYLVDPKQQKPLKLLLLAGFYGVLSLAITIGLGLLLHNFTDLDHGNVADQMIRALIFVGLLEEASKFLFIRGFLFNSKYFNKPYDGIVFSMMVGMGFAIAETIIYVLNGDGGTALVRMFTAVPAHALFAIIMGFFIGEAKVFKSSSGLFNFLGLFFASFAHGYYDYFIFLDFFPGLWIQPMIFLVIVIIATHFAFKYRKDEILEPD